jgi:PKD repeat protein
MGALPPTAVVQATGTQGVGVLNVNFSCACTAGSHPVVGLLWDFGDGSQSVAAAPSHTFLSGSYRVHLVATDSVGLFAQDAVSVSVSRGSQLPPTARAFADPPTGPGPLVVTFLSSAAASTGAITAVDWDFGDGEHSSGFYPVRHTFAQPGVYLAKLTATDGVGLSASDSVGVTVTSDGAVPPAIISLPATVAYVGAPYHYGDATPQARGSRPIKWSLASPVPAGATVQAATGEIFWTPSAAQAGSVRLDLVATNGAGSAHQSIAVTVLSSAPHTHGCTAGAGTQPGPSGALMWVLVALVGWGGWRARRGSAKMERRP